MFKMILPLAAVALAASPALAGAERKIAPSSMPVPAERMAELTTAHNAALAAVKRYLDANPTFANSAGRLPELDRVNMSYYQATVARDRSNLEQFAFEREAHRVAVIQLCARIHTC